LAQQKADRQEYLSNGEERSDMKSRYETVKEIETVVSGFENCTTAKEEFTHLSHLTIATYYLHSSTPDAALEQMRLGLLRFLDHHGINRAKYDERLTSAWIEKIRRFVAQLDAAEQLDTDTSLVTITNAVLDELGEYRVTLN
jgi:hypothetical protein